MDEDYKKFTESDQTSQKNSFCISLDFNYLIDFYSLIIYIYIYIYIIGIYGNNYEYKILYENSNCKIYDQS
jgi:hypothetical protein